MLIHMAKAIVETWKNAIKYFLPWQNRLAKLGWQEKMCMAWQKLVVVTWQKFVVVTWQKQ